MRIGNVSKRSEQRHWRTFFEIYSSVFLSCFLMYNTEWSVHAVGNIQLDSSRRIPVRTNILFPYIQFTVVSEMITLIIVLVFILMLQTSPRKKIEILISPFNFIFKQQSILWMTNIYTIPYMSKVAKNVTNCKLWFEAIIVLFPIELLCVASEETDLMTVVLSN